MKIYIIINKKKEVGIKKPEDIKLEMVYGIYYKRNKSFWECKLANSKKKEGKYIIKEVDIAKNVIKNTYKIYNNYSVIDKKREKYNIISY